MAPDPYLGRVITAFEGGISTRVITHPSHPDRVFAYEVTFLLQHPRVVSVASLKPPLHFHPHQEEYVQVLEGRLALEIEGKEHVLGPEDGEMPVRPWTNHRLYSPVADDTEAELKVTRFMLSAESTPELFRLDTVFFENWYAYQDQIVVKGEKIDLVQVMSMFDAGGSYLSLPRWIPFSRTIARALGILSACRKMEMSIFQRRFADRSKTE
ncbi:hypothetical protein F4677DRAFT_444908 [Hypoxylon crocopeplum]|nr:hypothetical protein F4677DRAFT_444908 [Hypoxylon crocopeplum]